MTDVSGRFLTRVELLRLEGRIERWLRFGHPVERRQIDRQRRLVAFAPDSVFAYVRWAANDFGTVASRIDIVRAVARFENCQTLPFVRPGGEIFLAVSGWGKVRKVLDLISAIEREGIDPVEVSPDHWRHVHNRLAAGHEPRGYTVEQHSVFLMRRRIEP